MSPLYDYECTDCGEIEERFYHLKHRKKVLYCKCGGVKKTIITCKSDPLVCDYYDENLKTFITGPGHRKRVMKELEISEK